ncbi:MAG TPA: RNA polymerase sigma factor [Bacteroidetes bacterium]|nr:RNA polymerase sigma factor [Bacteroidota bacterium]
MDRNEFKTSILPIKNKLFRFSLNILNDVAEAEDVVQEVFIKLWNRRDQMDQINNTEAWCMRVTRNLSIDKMRSKHRRLEPMKEGFDLKDQSPTPFQKTAGSDVFSKIKNLMLQLPDKQRMVMQLRDIEGLTYQEVADALEISLDQVKVNIYRARLSMRKKLEMINLTPKSI